MFSSNGELIAVGSPGPAVNVYQVKDGKRMHALKGHSGAVFTLAFSPDGKQLAAGGYDGMVRLYELAKGTQVRGFWPVPLKDTKAASK